MYIKNKTPSYSTRLLLLLLIRPLVLLSHALILFWTNADKWTLKWGGVNSSHFTLDSHPLQNNSKDNNCQRISRSVPFSPSTIFGPLSVSLTLSVFLSWLHFHCTNCSALSAIPGKRMVWPGKRRRCYQLDGAQGYFYSSVLNETWSEADRSERKFVE